MATKKKTTKATKKTTKASAKTAKKSAKKKPAARKTAAKKTAAKKATTKKPVEKEVEIVTDDAQVTPAAPKAERRGNERRKVQRRRQIDPTTCERDYSNDEIEFMRAMDEYKRNNGRMFPTCSEILEVVRALGYVRQDPNAAPAIAESTTPTSSDQDANQQPQSDSVADPVIPPLSTPDASVFNSTDAIGQ